MVDELEFRKLVEIALDSLKQHLILLEEEDDAGFEVEEQNGVLNVLFEEPPGKFVITPNTLCARSGYRRSPPASNSTGTKKPPHLSFQKRASI